MVARKRKAKVEELDLSADAPPAIVAPVDRSLPVESPPPPPVESPPPPPVESPPPPPPSSPKEDAMMKMMVKMEQMQELIERQTSFLALAQEKMQEKMQEPTPPPVDAVEKEDEMVGLAWPVEKDTPEDLDWPIERAVSEAPRSRDAPDRTVEEMYAGDMSVPSEQNIVLADASSNVFGDVHQVQTRVGLRTRGLLLNPTLQQPSIGGLM